MGHTIFQKNYLVNIFNFSKNNNFKSMAGQFFFVFYSICYWVHFISKKFFSKFWTSISWSKDRLRSYIGIPSGAQTNIIAHTKGEPRARLSNPFLCRKTILETIKSFSVSDLIKYPITSIFINYYI